MKLIMIVLKILFLGALFITSNQNLYLSDSGDRDVFYDMYFSWLNTLVVESRDFTTYFMKSEWLPSVDQQLDDTFRG
jgi:hypothetical protein